MYRPATVVIVAAASAASRGSTPKCVAAAVTASAALARFQRPGNASRKGTSVPSSTSVSPSSRFGVAGCPKPHDGQSNRSALQRSSAAQFGQVAASLRQPSPSSTHVVLAGVAAHTTCGSDALATTRRSGCVSAE